ncbi:MAG: hypothetical protein WDM77_01645 [Steroidobacteraceae bacterium]
MAPAGTQLRGSRQGRICGGGPAAKIQYVDMPAAIRPNYQYFTQAPMERLRQAGYSRPFTPIEDGVREYVQRYLSQPDRYR